MTPIQTACVNTVCNAAMMVADSVASYSADMCAIDLRIADVRLVIRQRHSH